MDGHIMKKITAITLLTLSATAFANWTFVKQGEGYKTYLHDKVSGSTVTDDHNNKRNVVKAMILKDLLTIKYHDNLPYKSWVTTYEFDCENKKYRDPSYTLYDQNMGKGNPIKTVNSDENKRFYLVPPLELMDFYMKAACDKYRK